MMNIIIILILILLKIYFEGIINNFLLLEETQILEKIILTREITQIDLEKIILKEKKIK